MKSIEEEAKKAEDADYLTGLLGRKSGDRRITQAMKEQPMTCMEKVIQVSLRNVDVCARFSSEQFLVILMNAGEDDIAELSGLKE